MEEAEQQEGMECLYQFKTEECNPLNLTDKCKEILSCVQESQKELIKLKCSLR